MTRLDLLTANDRPGEYPPSWYAATATPLPRFPALAGEARGRRLRDRRRLHRALGGAAPCRGRARRGAPRGAAGGLGRVGPQRRADGVGAAPRAGLDRAALRQGPARALWDMAEEAKALVRDLVARHGIACDLRPGVIHAACRAGEVAAFHAEAETLARDYGYAATEPLDRDGIRGELATEAYHGGVLDRGAGHLHPLNYALGLARAAAAAGARIFEGSRADAVGDGAASRGAHRRRAGAGAPRGGRRQRLSRRAHAGGLGAGDADQQLHHRHRAARRSRGGGAHPQRRGGGGFAVRGELLPALGRPPAAVRRRRELRLPLPRRHRRHGAAADARRSFRSSPAAPIEHAWGGTLAITANRMPAFQRLAPNVFAAGGYSGHGVALATLAGKLMAEAVQGTAERFDVFARLPQPSFPGGAAPALAAAGAGDELVRAARSALSRAALGPPLARPRRSCRTCARPCRRR